MAHCVDSGVPARDALQCALARRTEIRSLSGWRRPPGRPDLATSDW